MPEPQLVVKLDWDGDGFTTGAHDDVSQYAVSAGEVIVDITLAANDVGSCTLLLVNHDNRFTPQNAAGPLYGKLKPGAQIWVAVEYDGVSYPRFHGYIRSIKPRGDGYCQVFAQDAFFRFSRQQVHIQSSDTRSITAFREAILDSIGEPASRRVFHDIEYPTPMTGSDGRDVLGLLNELCAAVWSIHYIRPAPLATLYQYVVKARSYLQSRSPSFDFTDTQVMSSDGFEVADTMLVNAHRVKPRPQVRSSRRELLWERDRVQIDPGETMTLWARWDDDLVLRRSSTSTFDAYTSYRLVAGSATVATTFFRNSAKLVITATAAGAIVDAIRVFGAIAVELDLDSVLREDAASIAAHGLWEAKEFSSEWLPNRAEAAGVAGYVVWRYGAHKERPALRLQDQFPAMFQIEPGDRVRFDNGRLNFTDHTVEVQSIQTQLHPGKIWVADIKTEEAPPTVNVFTMGGTADQGIGGTAVLAY